MARTDNNWNERLGTWLETAWAEGRDLLINGFNHYINFGSDNGVNGYGFRDNNGTMEFKNSGGAWAGFGSGGGGGSGSVIDATNSGDDQNYNLSAEPSSEYLVLMNNGVYSEDDTAFPYSISGATLSFDSALPADLASKIIKVISL